MGLFISKVATKFKQNQVSLKFLALLIPIFAVFLAFRTEIPITWPIPLLFFFILLIIANCIPGWLGFLLSLSVTLIIYILPLISQWQNSPSIASTCALGGLIPMAGCDATVYYHDARLMLIGAPITIAYRPLFTGLLALILGLTNQNLKITLAIFVVMNGFATFIVLREFQKNFGIIISTITTFFILFWYGPWAGLMMTEQLGLLFGALSTLLLIRGIKEKNVRLYLLGTFLFTSGSMARSGALLVLPLMVIFSIWFFRKYFQNFYLFLLLNISVIIIPFILNSIFTSLVAGSNSAAFGNFSYTFYGLATGTNRWLQIFQDHPEVAKMRSDLIFSSVYSFAFEEIRKNPFNLVIGSIKAWKDYFSLDLSNSVFGFVGVIIREWEGKLILLFLYFCSLISVLKIIWDIFRRKYDPINIFILIINLGIFLSVPFLPPADVGIRTYVVTFFFAFLLPLSGLSLILSQINKLLSPLKKRISQFTPLFNQINFKLESYYPSNRSLYWGGCLITCFVFVIPVFIRSFSTPPQNFDSTCESGESLIIYSNPSSAINIIDDSRSSQTYLVPDVPFSAIKSMLSYYSDPYIGQDLANLKPGESILNGLNLISKERVWVITLSSNIPLTPGNTKACGTYSLDTKLSTKVFYANSMKIIK